MPGHRRGDGVLEQLHHHELRPRGDGDQLLGLGEGELHPRTPALAVLGDAHGVVSGGPTELAEVHSPHELAVSGAEDGAGLLEQGGQTALGG